MAMPVPVPVRGARAAHAHHTGIAEAMWNTFLGLLIAVICMFFHLILHSMAKKQKHEMEKAAQKLENLLVLRRQG